MEDTEKFEKAKYVENVIADEDGYVQEINAEEIGKVACSLGAGRIKKEDNIDYSVGIILCKKVSEEVKKGDVLAKIYANDENKLKNAKNDLESIIKINENKVETKSTILLKLS